MDTFVRSTSLKAALIRSTTLRACSLVESRNAETILLTILQVAAKIHAFFRAYLDLGFGVALRRSAKSPSPLIGVVGGRRVSRLRLPS